MILKCAIIDDEPLAISLLESYVNKTPFLELAGKYNSAVNELPALSKEPVDLLFLDIQMPELNGMEFSRILKTDTRIIFTTAFSQYALDSYKVNALDYLLKPISYADFLKSANKALQWYELLREGASTSGSRTAPSQAVSPSVESIFIKTEYKLVQVELRKILYIEGLKDYVKIFVEGEAHPFADEYEKPGRHAAGEPLHPRAPLLYRPAGKDQSNRTQPDCVRQRIHPHLRQLQTEVHGVSGTEGTAALEKLQ